MTQSPHSGWKGFGSVVDINERDRRLHAYCKSSLSMAGTLRKSGCPETAMNILSGTIAIQLTLVYRRFCDKDRTFDDTMVERLRGGGHITAEQRDTLIDGLTAIKCGPTRGVSDAVKAATVLHHIMVSDAYKSAGEPKVTPEPVTSSRPSMLRRWATAAAGLFTVGASS